MASQGKTGVFITFEGGEGCGKSVQVERLANHLRSLGCGVVVTREPGGTAAGEQIRHVLQYSPQALALASETELLLFCASRAQLVRELIRPALRDGQIVLCDRFHDSTTVYQGAGRGLDTHWVATLNGFAMGSCRPDLTLVIDLDPRIGLERARGRELFDRMENQSMDFYQRVREGYLELAKREPQRVKTVEGAQNVDAVEREIWGHVKRVVETCHSGI